MEPATAATSTGGAPARQKLEGRLGTTSIVFTVLAFNAPLAVMGGFVPIVISTGNQQGAPMSFLAIMVILLLFAVGLTTMARFMHSPGAFYSYIVSGLGRITGLGGGFVAFLAYSAFCICSYAFAGLLVNALVTGVFNGPEIPWWIWSLVTWGIATTFSMLNIDLSAKVLGVAMVAEIVLVLLWSLRVFFQGGPSGIPSSFSIDAFLSGSPSGGLLFAVLCITGFEACAVFRDEAKNPNKSVPRATYISVIFLCGFYALGALAYLTAFGSDAVTAAADPSGSFSQSIQVYVGTAAKDVTAVLLVSSAFASLLANHNIAARYLYTLGSDGVLPQQLGRVSRRHGSPIVAAQVFAGIPLVGIIISAASGRDPVWIYATFAAIGSLCLLVLMTVTSIAVVRFFHKDSTHTANIWQGTVAPILAFLGLATVLVLALTHFEAVTGGSATLSVVVFAVIIVVALAGGVLAAYFRARRPEVYLQIGRRDL